MSVGKAIKNNTLTGVKAPSTSLVADFTGKNLNTTYVQVGLDGGEPQRMSINAFLNAIAPLLGTVTNPGGGGTTPPVNPFDTATYNEYVAAVQGATVGGKRVAGANALISAFGTHRLKIFRSGVEIVNIGYSGNCSLSNSGGVVSLGMGTISTTSNLTTADLSTGTWTFQLQGGASFARTLTGTVGPSGSGADIILSASPVAGMGLDPSLTLVLPTTLDA